MARAIFGLARHMIQKNLKIKKKYFEKFEAKNGVKIDFAVWVEEVLRPPATGIYAKALFREKLKGNLL